MTDQEIVTAFTYHPPTAIQKCDYGLLRERAKELARLINAIQPESREKSLAITKLREAIMWANAGIAINTPGMDGRPCDK